MYDDCQYAHDSKIIKGVFATLNESLLSGWKTLLQDALKPWTLEFYKEAEPEDEGISGVGSSYTIEQWDIKSNAHVATYALGYKQEGSYVQNVFDEYIKVYKKDIGRECDIILQQWLDQVVSGV
jgi:hypothetical protein